MARQSVHALPSRVCSPCYTTLNLCELCHAIGHSCQSFLAAVRPKPNAAAMSATPGCSPGLKVHHLHGHGKRKRPRNSKELWRIFYLPAGSFGVVEIK